MKMWNYFCSHAKNMLLFVATDFLLFVLNGCGGSGEPQRTAIEKAIDRQQSLIDQWCFVFFVAVIIMGITALFMPRLLEAGRNAMAKLFPIHKLKIIITIGFYTIVIACLLFVFIDNKYTPEIFDCGIFFAALFCSFFYYKDIYKTFEDSSREAVLRRKAALGYMKTIVIVIIVFGFLIYKSIIAIQKLEKLL